MKLPTPVSKEREAFCCRGCYQSFYLHRRRVCEERIEQPKHGQRTICKKAKCRNAWNGREGFGKYAVEHFSAAASKNPEDSSKNAMDALLFSASDTVEQANKAFAPRPWRMVAGSLTANQYHCAVVSDAPDGGLPDIPYAKVWSGGVWERDEAKSRKRIQPQQERAAA